MPKKARNGKNTELQKQIGCVYGFFQLFDPHHFLPGRRLSKHERKNLPQGTREVNIRSQENNFYAESNTNSASSSSRSSCLSSLEFSKVTQSDTQCSNVHEIVKDSICKKSLVLPIGRDEGHFGHPKKYIDSPRPSYHKRSDSNGDAAVDMSRHSYDGMDIQFRSTMKIKEIPRLSLDSKVRMIKGSSKEEDHQKTPRTQSVIAKLMGMDTSPSLSNSFPREPVPPSSPISVYGEMEKRLSTLEFKKSGKDLRALKHILEAMQKTKDSMDVKRKQTSDSAACMDKTGNLNERSSITMKAAKITRKDSKSQSLRDQRFTTEATKWMQTRKMTGEKNTNPARKAGAQSRRSQKDEQVPKEKVSWKKSVKSSNLHEVPKQFSKIRKSYSHGDDNISLKVNKLKILSSLNNSDGGLTNKDSEAKHATITSEHPSPVSVLDATYYRDDPPSPIKKKSISFKEDDSLKSHNVEHNSSDICHCQNITKAHLDMQIDYGNWNETNHSRRVNNSRNQGFNSNVMVPIFRRKNPKERSIREVTSESVSDCGHLVNSDFKESYMTVEETNNIKQIHRKLISDVALDILVERGVLESTPLQFLSPVKGAVRKPKVQQLLASVCSEIDQLQSDNRSSSPDDDEKFTRLLSRELEHHSEKWGGGGTEASETVLAVERLIFKDLITEFVSGDNGLNYLTKKASQTMTNS